MDHAIQLVAIQLVILLLILLYRRAHDSAADYSPEMLQSAACSDKLVTFSSSCLPFIEVFPQNLTAFPPPQCCDDFSAAVGGDSAVCLLYAALKQRIVEFPIDSSKLLSLASVCPLKDRKSKARISNETLCSESAALPPLRCITGPNITMPSNSKSHPPSVVGSTKESPPTKETTHELPPPQPISKKSYGDSMNVGPDYCSIVSRWLKHNRSISELARVSMEGLIFFPATVQSSEGVGDNEQTDDHGQPEQNEDNPTGNARLEQTDNNPMGNRASEQTDINPRLNIHEYEQPRWVPWYVCIGALLPCVEATVVVPNIHQREWVLFGRRFLLLIGIVALGYWISSYHG